MTNIGYYAFDGCQNLTQINIPDGVIKIKDCTFCNCANLKSIKISRSVISIGNQAFDWCGMLTDVYYDGTEAQWKAIEITANGNDYLLNAILHTKSSNFELYIGNTY